MTALPARRRFTRQDTLALIVIVLVGLVVFGVILRTIFGRGGMDFGAHVQWAIVIAERGLYFTSHPVYQYIVIAAAWLLPSAAWETAGLVASLVIAVATPITVFALVRRHFRRPLAAAGVALALSVAGPITLLTLHEPSLFWNYIVPNALQSPTTALLRPLALLLFFAIVALIDHPPTPRRLLVLFVLSVLMTGTKPNYALCLLPILALWSLYHFWRGDRSRSIALVLSVIVPASVILVLQYVLKFNVIDASGTAGGSWLGESGIALAPFSFATYVDGSPLRLLFKLPLSILFPLCVFIIYRDRTWRDSGFLLGWAIVIAAQAQYLLFAETGTRFGHGNFISGSQVALFNLFVYAAWTMAQTYQGARPAVYLRDRRWQVCTVVLVLHVICGALWFAAHLTVDPFAFG